MDSIKCNKCANKTATGERKFKNYGGHRTKKSSDKGRTQSKNVIANSYNLYKPFRPCRRTCHVDHHPMHHAERMQEEHLQRLHASATKLMIMKIVPDRPGSADSATREFERYKKDIDFFSSTIHSEAIEGWKEI